jgi:hypothetical protein
MHDAGEQTVCILFFVKYPEAGNVKTRLSNALDDGSAARLYQCFVTDLLAMLRETGYPVTVCYTPADKEKAFQEWLGNQYHYMPQRGGNLGERLQHGFSEAFARGYDGAVAIGSDSPDLPARFIHEACAELEHDSVVIGPAIDGGYYLIGFTRHTFSPRAFEGIEWSTPTVFAETLRRLQDSSKEGDIHILPAWKDVDTLEDLQALYHRSQESSFASSDTMRYIGEHVL